MATFTTTLVKKELVAQETLAFYFEKPEGFSFIPGQHGTLRLIDPAETDEEGNERTFSFITTPDEPVVGFATRLRDTAFKRVLRDMSEGTTVEIKDPRGDMVLPDPVTRPMVILSGGIGITPFMSMIKQYAQQPREVPLYLFYANRTIEEAAFLNDLTQPAKSSEKFTFIPTMTRLSPDDSTWKGETGYVTKEMIERYVPDISNTVFYTAGPAGMVSGMKTLLTELGVDPLFIKSEDYGEYK